MTYKSLLIALLLMLQTVASAQKTYRIQQAVGRWEVSNDITPKQAEEQALLEAKKEALRRAGIVENVWSVFGHVAKNNNNQFFESSNAMSSISINGLVRVKAKKVKEEFDNDRGVMFKVVTIDCDVQEGTLPDPEFELEVNNLKEVYNHGEPLTFTVKAHNRDAYLHIFWFDNQTGEILYPNTSEQQILLKANQTYTFPLNQAIDYQTCKSEANNPTGQNNLLMVATKESIPYIGEVNFQNVIEWTFKLPADKRATNYKMFIIR